MLFGYLDLDMVRIGDPRGYAFQKRDEDRGPEIFEVLQEDMLQKRFEQTLYGDKVWEES